jgi:Mannosyltransferase (PIG-V)
VNRRRSVAMAVVIEPATIGVEPVAADSRTAEQSTDASTGTGSSGPRDGRTRRSPWATDLAVAAPPWAAARAIVLASLALAHFLVTNLHVTDKAVSSQLHQGLFAWDAGFYRGIAAHGYRFGAVPHESLRFFPLVPLAARALGILLGGRSDIALLILGNGSALIMAALLHRLVLIEKGDPAMARRATWLVALVPPAFVLVLGYSEAIFMALGVGMFIALRTSRWVWAALLGALAGLTRPLGLLLFVPAAIEAGRSLIVAGQAGTLDWRARWSGRMIKTVAARAAAVISPLAGTGAFLWWAGVRYGDALLPLRIQEDATRRGSVVDPVTALLHEGRGILHGHHVGSGLHVPWAIALVVLVIVCARRWPACYAAFAAAMLLAALSSKNLDSLERYALSAFPFVLVGASLTASPRVERLALVLGAAAMEGYSLLAFLNAVVP